MATHDKRQPKSGGLMHIVFASVGVSLLGLLIGFSIAAILLSLDVGTTDPKHGTKAESPTGKKEHSLAAGSGVDEPSVSSEEKPIGEYGVVPLQPIVTNLADSTDIWVRLEASALINKKSEESAELLAARLSQNILAYMRTLKISDIQGAGALQAISQDLNEVVTTVSGGQAQGVLISGLVFE
jgi:Flagellar basal body-associated protein FliL